jgi:hypothetical protein
MTCKSANAFSIFSKPFARELGGVVAEVANLGHELGAAPTFATDRHFASVAEARHGREASVLGKDERR